jgi:hypothetical protein
LSIRSATFRVADSRSVGLDTVAGHRQVVNIPRTGNPPPIDFNITDLQPGR